VEHSIIPLIVKLHQFKPLVDGLSFRIFPPDVPDSFVLQFNKLQDLEGHFERFKTQLVFFSPSVVDLFYAETARLSSYYFLPERSPAWDVLFISPTSSSSKFTPRPSLVLSSSSVSDSIGVFSVPYPKLRKALTIKLPLALSKQKHPTLSPSTKLTWTENKRAMISEVIKNRSRQATTYNQLMRLVSDLFFFFL
jgi:hypothetical protein